MIKQSKKQQYSEIFNENAKIPAVYENCLSKQGQVSVKTVRIFPLKINDCIIENSKDIANE